MESDHLSIPPGQEARCKSKIDIVEGGVGRQYLLGVPSFQSFRPFRLAVLPLLLEAQVIVSKNPYCAPQVPVVTAGMEDPVHTQTPSNLAL